MRETETETLIGGGATAELVALGLGLSVEGVVRPRRWR